jgi:dienelactone hydrolase
MKLKRLMLLAALWRSSSSNLRVRGVILAQHIPVGHTGIENDEFTLVTAARIASEGYVVAVPFIFHWWPKGEDAWQKLLVFLSGNLKDASRAL